MGSFIIDTIGYFALVINLYSMSLKGELRLRTYSLVANIIYIFYGVLIEATPIILGCTIAVILHIFRISNLKPINKND